MNLGFSKEEVSALFAELRFAGGGLEKAETPAVVERAPGGGAGGIGSAAILGKRTQIPQGNAVELVRFWIAGNENSE